jgi:lipopolysaccharide export system permease protein
VFRIIDRYIFRETSQTFIAVTGVLLVILIGHQFARVLGKAAADQIPKDTVLLLLGLTSIQFLIVLVPLALFLSIMLALGRLYRDSEMTAIRSCGVSQHQLYRPLISLALILAGVVAWFSLDVGPWARNRIVVLESTAGREAAFGEIEAGRFLSTDNGESVFYAENVADDGTFNNVFIQRRVDERIEVAVAERAEIRRDSTDQRTLVLYDGRRYDGVPGSAVFRIIHFSEPGIPVTLPPPVFRERAREQQSTAELMQSNDPKDRVELQWRFSLPVAVLLLTMLAVPLARTNPREGRYGRLAIAVLIYLVYSNLLGAARVWAEQELVPIQLGVWWVHALLFIGTVILLRRQNRVRRGSMAAVIAKSATDTKSGAVV